METCLQGQSMLYLQYHCKVGEEKLASVKQIGILYVLFYAIFIYTLRVTIK